MLPEPLHPAVVHFPIVLAVLLPLIMTAALWAIHRGTAPRRAWSLALGVTAALTVASWAAVQTGEAQEDRVEAVVPEAPFESHEHAAERFLVLTVILTLVAAAGLLPGLAGRAARGVATLGAAVVLLAGVQVGHSGGELVYRHGAASAYAQAGQDGRTSPARPSRERDDDLD